MVRPKPSSSKKSNKRGGVDFKKIKRKIGRKLPPPKNATNTQVKSKAIVLPEQSVASEKAGLAVNRKGLTLKELLQQSSHHNAKVRKDALLGIRDLAHKYPEELSLHVLAVIEKLRERISDDDKLVRETLYQLLKSVIFPSTKEEIPGPIISLMMAYVFNAMTHIAIDIRLMAFKFFELVVLHYPSSFFSYAEKVFRNYEDILQNSQTYLQEKSNLKTALGGLVQCLSLLSCEKKVDPSHDQVPRPRGALHTYGPELTQEHTGFSSYSKKLEDLLTVLGNCFQEFVPLVRNMPTVEPQSFDCMQCILQSINLIVKIFSGEIKKLHATYGVSIPSCRGPNESLWGGSLMPVKLKKLFEAFPLYHVHQSAEKQDRRYFALNVGIAEIFLHLNDCLGSPAILLEKFIGFVEHVLSPQIIGDPSSNKLLLEKHSVSLLQFIPRLVALAMGKWRSRLLEAFTKAFMGCKPGSTLNLVCLSVIEEMLLPTQQQCTVVLDVISPELTGYAVIWMRRLPDLLLSLGDRQPSATKVILQLLLHLGHCAPVNSSLIEEYDNMQFLLREFYSIRLAEEKDEGSVWHGPFIRLPKDCQELAISCLYYFSWLDSRFLESLAWCCLSEYCKSCCSIMGDAQESSGDDTQTSDALDPGVILRIIEILHSAYKAGHLQITDHVSFLVTLLARFKVFPEKVYLGAEKEEMSNRGSFKAIADAVSSCICQMGDNAIILKILQKVVLNEMSQKLSLDNMCAILRMVIMLNVGCPRLPEENIIKLCSSFCHYLTAAATCIPDNDDEIVGSDHQHVFRYYTQPAIFLFYRNEKLLSLVLKWLGASIMQLHPAFPSDCSSQSSYELLNKVNVIMYILRFMLEDFELKPSLTCCKEDFKDLLQTILKLQASKESDMTLHERHKIQKAFDQLKLQIDSSHLWDADDFKSIF